MKYIKGLYWLVGLIFVVTLISLLAAHQLRAEFTWISQLHENVCKVNLSPDKKDCDELAELTDSLMNVKRELTTEEVAYCSILELLKLGKLNNTCNQYQVAVDLKNEIEDLMKAADVLEKYN
ncbi:hypothetical protein [Methylophaga sp. UBA2689]|jgi:hypothetical protein|uniref:hypothetical protein n=1 Tax=Methylophaga sp. UBA2689 TaxID=1946878 RepID=UPI002600A698|nr:hypothetical protein [Methylophaga sp. UBA2689]|tara:strand:- start:2690 stop:3055 length:366 start_codon:yes stop_codon:yes gene_type:complete